MVSLRIANRPYSERKISETFLDFVAPLMAAAGAVATKGQVEQALKIAFAVWNSVVFDTKRRNTAYLTRIRQLTVNDPLSAVSRTNDFSEEGPLRRRSQADRGV